MPKDWMVLGFLWNGWLVLNYFHFNQMGTSIAWLHDGLKPIGWVWMDDLHLGSYTYEKRTHRFNRSLNETTSSFSLLAQHRSKERLSYLYCVNH